MDTKNNLQAFEPGVYIKLMDVFTGQRKMARVSDTGQSYFDLDDEDSTPFPIYTELQPMEVGNILGWGLHIVDNRPEHASAFRELVDRLINSGVDVLTYNRAAHWAFENNIFDYDKALEAGTKETEAIRAGRKSMDAVIRAAEVSQ